MSSPCTDGSVSGWSRATRASRCRRIGRVSRASGCGPRETRATHASHNGRFRHSGAMPARKVNVSPAASSVSNSDTMSWCQKSSRLSPGRISCSGPLTERLFDDVPDIEVGDAPRPQRAPELPERKIRTRAECIRSSLHTLMEGQVLKRMKRVVVNEDADGALVRQHLTRRGERSLDRVVRAVPLGMRGHLNAPRPAWRGSGRCRRRSP